MMEQRVVFLSTGLQLEGVLHLPEGSGPHPGVVVCHPHPRYGGAMDNNVVMAVCAALGEVGISSLRFNFRGVGRSQGFYDDGIGEQEDVVGAITYLAGLKELNPDRLGLAGYSFGAGVALGVADQHPAFRALALISLPVRIMGLEPGSLSGFQGAKLLVVGSADSLADKSAYGGFVGSFPEPKQLEIVSGADHFWMGYEDKLGEMVARFFAQNL